MKKLGLILLFVLPIIVRAQQPPGTEIYLLDLSVTHSKVTAGNPQNVTNRQGYDNQPFFHPDQSLLYYTTADAEGKTDLVEYNYKTKKSRNLTNTPEREYSPTVTPDKKFISCILQRDSGAQDLVKYPIQGGEPQIIINNMIVGYHAWADENKVIVFTLPQPFKLHLLNVKTASDTILAEQIGRSLHKIPRKNALSFIQKVTDDEWTINSLDVGTLLITEITKSLPGKEHDMAWTPDGKIIMSDGKKLFFYQPGKADGWQEIEMAPNMPTGTITRLAVNPNGDQLAIVVSE